jgi:hypothetical protein
MHLGQLVDAELYNFNVFVGCFQTYSGFYKTHLEPYIDNPGVLLRGLGYELTADHKLKILSSLPDRQTLVRAAFDFFLAAAECRTIESIVSNCKRSAIEVYRYRRRNACDVNECMEALQSSLNIGGLNAGTIVGDADFEQGSVQRSVTDEIQVESCYFAGTDQLSRTDSPLRYGFHPPVPSSVLTPTGDYFLKGPPSPARQQVFSTFMRPGRIVDATDCGLLNESDAFAPTTQLPGHQYQYPAAARHTPAEPTAGRSYQLDDRWNTAGVPSRPNVGYNMDVDQLAAILKEVDPGAMTDSQTRRRILSNLRKHDSSSRPADRRPHTEPMISRERVRTASEADGADVSDRWICPSCGRLMANRGGCDFCRMGLH